MSCTDDKWLESQSWGIWLWSGAGGVFCEEGALKTVGKRVRCEGTHRTGTTAGGQGLCPPRLELASSWRVPGGQVCALWPPRPAPPTRLSGLTGHLFLTPLFRLGSSRSSRCLFGHQPLMPWPRTTERAAEMQSEERGGAPVFYSHTTFPFFPMHR